MRKEAKNNINVSMARVQGYHEEGSGETYAFRGFNGNWYFNSDRKIRLDESYRRADGQPLQGYGLEIETECTGIRNRTVLAEVYDKIIFPVFKFGADMFKMQRDGSLGGDTSAEVITQIMTKSRVRNDYAAYKAMFNEYFPAFGISADCYSTSCGMHVNVSNACFGKTEEAQKEAIRKLYYFINRNYSMCCKLLYRNPSRTRYCSRMDYSHDVLYSPGFFRMGSHGVCMNLSHFNVGRIEIRLVGGQKSFACFRNTMESVFHLVERMGSMKWEDMDKLDVVFKGCNQYVYDRLQSMCREYIPADVLDRIAQNVKREQLI